jgi:hypothetical protein
MARVAMGRDLMARPYPPPCRGCSPVVGATLAGPVVIPAGVVISVGAATAAGATTAGAATAPATGVLRAVAAPAGWRLTLAWFTRWRARAVTVTAMAMETAKGTGMGTGR